MTDAPSPRCSSGSVDDFDAMSKQFTAWVATAANWKERYAGAAYSTRIKAAIVDLKWVIAQAEMHPEIGGAAQAQRVPKVRTSHHRNKEEAARLQGMVDKKYATPEPKEITMQDVRLVCGEGKLEARHVLNAVNIIVKRRAEMAGMRGIAYKSPEQRLDEDMSLFNNARADAFEEAAKVVEDFPYQMLHMWERPGGPPGNGYRDTRHEDIAAAVRALAVPSTDREPGWIDQNHQIDRYGVALYMIREGCSDPSGLARRILSEFEGSTVTSTHEKSRG